MATQINLSDLAPEFPAREETPSMHVRKQPVYLTWTIDI